MRNLRTEILGKEKNVSRQRRRFVKPCCFIVTKSKYIAVNRDSITLNLQYLYNFDMALSQIMVDEEGKEVQDKFLKDLIQKKLEVVHEGLQTANQELAEVQERERSWRNENKTRLEVVDMIDKESQKQNSRLR